MKLGLKLAVFIVLLGRSAAIAGGSRADSAILQKALRIYGVANFNLEYGPHGSPSSDAEWASEYVHSQREKAVGAAVEMVTQEAKKSPLNEQLLFGLNQFLCFESNSFGGTAHENARLICKSILRKKILFFRENKNPSFSEEAAEWQSWWGKFKDEEYIQNYDTEVKSKLEQLLTQFFSGNPIESRSAAIKLDTLPPRERIYVEILTSSFLIDKTSEQRRTGIYLKRCMELISHVHVPVPDPHLSDDHKTWRAWIRSVNQTINYQSIVWPGNFFQNLDREKIIKPPVREY